MMEIRVLWEFLKRRWWMIILPAFVVLLLLLPSLPNMLQTQPSYTTALRFTAAAATDQGSTYEDSAYVPWLASEYVVVNLPHWVTSDSFAQEVSTLLAGEGITITHQDVRAALAADSARSILVVYISGQEAAQVEAIARAVVTVLQTRNQTYFPQFAAHPAQVVALDDVRVSALAPSVFDRFSPLLRLLVGVAAGLALAVGYEYLDDTLRDENELAALGLTVIGRIPPQ